jgi:hypoxanthine phosphoribosyltransferase
MEKYDENQNQKNLVKSEILGEVLFPSSVIQKKITELGRLIAEDYKDKDPILISVLRGGIFFLSDLVRKIDLEISIDFIGISTYQFEDSTMTGVVKITKDLEEPVEDKDILIVEDIIDTGLTVSYLLRNLEARYPRSVEICTLLDRNIRRIADIKIKYKCFTIGDEFVVGYGLDYKQKYRNLNAIYQLKVDTIKKDLDEVKNISSNET